MSWPPIRIWPFRVRWASFGWMYVEDPIDGSWHQIATEDAPWQWVKLAQDHKKGKR